MYSILRYHIQVRRLSPYSWGWTPSGYQHFEPEVLWPGSAFSFHYCQHFGWHCSVFSNTCLTGLSLRAASQLLNSGLLSSQSLKWVYRPISSLMFLSIMFERLVALQLVPYLEQSGLLPFTQSGFRGNHSMELPFCHSSPIFTRPLRGFGGVVVIDAAIRFAPGTLPHHCSDLGQVVNLSLSVA